MCGQVTKKKKKLNIWTVEIAETQENTQRNQPWTQYNWQSLSGGHQVTPVTLINREPQHTGDAAGFVSTIRYWFRKYSFKSH